MTLLPHHKQLIEASAITDWVAQQRNYWSATKAAELRRLGFSTVQAIVPSLVIPIRGFDGEIVNYQIRPDTPRVVEGRPLKYESPAGSHVVLDVPSGARRFLSTPHMPLWITEGARKADAAVSAEMVCVSLSGVSSWRTEVAPDVKTALPDLQRIKLDQRKVVIAFDSDVVVKPQVHSALVSFARWLESQGAWVHVLYLPGDENPKQGLDDFLARPHAGMQNPVEKLWEYVETAIRPLEVNPKQTPMPTWWLLQRIEACLRRFVYFHDERAEHELCVLSLWVLHTYALDAAESTPYLHITSPAKRSGKTRLLEILQQLCHEAMKASSITAAAVFQAIEEWHPTFLIDEVDSVFHQRSEFTETLRGVLNDGYRRNGYVIRGSQEGKPRKFSTWCPKAMGGIENNSLPDTLTDRSLKIGLERKLKNQSIERLRLRRVADQFADMRERLEDWALLAVDRLNEYDGPMIEQISDRAEEISEPLLAIAADAGGVWPARALAAVIACAEADSGAEDETILLLSEMRELFGRRLTDILSTKEILDGLRGNEELPFADLNANKLAEQLKPYGIGPHSIKFNQRVIRGYRKRQFEDAWRRYLPSQSDGLASNGYVPGAQAATAATGATSPINTGDSGVAGEGQVAGE